jgi:hypothetical protein
MKNEESDILIDENNLIKNNEIENLIDEKENEELNIIKIIFT